MPCQTSGATAITQKMTTKNLAKYLIAGTPLLEQEGWLRQ